MLLNMLKLDTAKLNTRLNVKTVFAGVVLLASVHTNAATEISEDAVNYSPTPGTMLVDGVVGKPLQLVAAVGGVATFLATLPFSFASGSTGVAAQKLVVAPVSELGRCLGCTKQQDQTRLFQYESVSSDQSNYGMEPVYYQGQPAAQTPPMTPPPKQANSHTQMIEPWTP